MGKKALFCGLCTMLLALTTIVGCRNTGCNKCSGGSCGNKYYPTHGGGAPAPVTHGAPLGTGPAVPHTGGTYAPPSGGNYVPQMTKPSGG